MKADHSEYVVESLTKSSIPQHDDGRPRTIFDTLTGNFFLTYSEVTLNEYHFFAPIKVGFVAHFHDDEEFKNVIQASQDQPKQSYASSKSSTCLFIY